MKEASVVYRRAGVVIQMQVQSMAARTVRPGESGGEDPVPVFSEVSLDVTGPPLEKHCRFERGINIQRPLGEEAF